MNSEYIFRKAQSPADAGKLRDLFNVVFYPEEVGVLAETIFQSFPGSKNDYWFIAEEAETGQVVSGFTLIPWTMEMESVRLKVAEMGIVGTLEAHRGQGLFRRLSQDFDRTLLEEHFDFAIIQGIPGFYGQFGYYYAVPLENNLNLPLHVISDLAPDGGCTFRLAGLEDIPFLMAQDEDYRAGHSLASVRDEARWHYLLTDSQQTETGAEYWIIEHPADSANYYCKISLQGFGTGLILSEVSERISTEALLALFGFCKQKSIERGKPYIRLNFHSGTSAGKLALSMGANPGRTYAWQTKIPDPIQLLTTLSPLLERRIQASSFAGFSGVFRLNFFKSAVDLVWVEGHLEQVRPADGECQYSLAINAANFPALCLGCRTWQEINHLHPDTFPGPQGSALFADALFPPGRAWIHQQY